MFSNLEMSDLLLYLFHHSKGIHDENNKVSIMTLTKKNSFYSQLISKTSRIDRNNSHQLIMMRYISILLCAMVSPAFCLTFGLSVPLNLHLNLQHLCVT